MSPAHRLAEAGDMLTITRPAVIVAASLALLGNGCAEENLVLPGSGTPSALVAVGGNNQSARVGQTLPSPLVVEVRDADGNGVPGVHVAWTTEGGGSVSSPEGVTDGGGRATVQWRLGTAPGVQRAIATLQMDDALREIFTASAVPEGSPQLAMATEPPATAKSGEPLSVAPVVQLRDDDGDPLREGGVSVTVAIASGGGELGGTRTRATDEEGRATFPGLVLSGEAGTRKLIFAAAGATSVTSRAIDVTAAPPASPGSIRIERGNNQTADPGSAVAVDPAVRVLDASGNPKSGVTVTFAVASGGGSVSGASAKSGSDGIATVGEWRLGSSGTNTLTASASGYSGSPLTFTATASAAPPPPPAAKRLEFAEQPRNAEEGEVMQTVRVRIVDADGDVVTSASHTVKLEIIRLRGSGNLSGDRDRPAVNGVASFDDLKVSKKGEYRLRATASGLESATSSTFVIDED
jgi:adhesin/invasin